MISIARWKIFLILAVVVFGFVYSAPNVMPEAARNALAKYPWLPHKTVNLGLDLRGGAHLLYEVDTEVVFKERADLLVQDIRSQFRDEKIGYSKLGTMDRGARVTLLDGAQGEEARKILRKQDPNLQVTTSADGKTIEAALNDSGVKTIQDQTLSQSIEIVRRRVDELGTTEPSITRQGENRILLQVPGADSEALKRIVGTTAKLTFHLVQDGAGGRSLPMAEDPTRKISINRRALLTGDMLSNAQPSFNQGGQAVVNFRFNNSGARRFCDITRDNVGKPFAIVLDNQVITAPVIRSEICGGQGEISGGFDVKGASDLALLLRAGALPAPMKVMEERTVGPTLGSDSVEAGKTACLMALLFITIFACTAYGLFGTFASIGIVVNVILILAVMSMLQATLTLPGIAGIVLTMGLAIDGNVLVFERIKEELRAGRSVISAIDTGYLRARTTITDSNLAALISAIILFSFGTGPIKGFAVTTCIGVATSYFTSLMFTRLIVLTWLKYKKPKAIPV